jgi:hypothetical protein
MVAATISHMMMDFMNVSTAIGCTYRKPNQSQAGTPQQPPHVALLHVRAAVDVL